MKIILGSSAKPRRMVLEQAGYVVEAMSPDIDEKKVRTDDYRLLPILVARAKAAALLPKITQPGILITADQVVLCHGELREKPQSPEEAKKFLASYSAGQSAETISAVVVTNTVSKKSADGIDIGKISFKKIPQKIIDEYIESGLPFKYAGGFAESDTLLKPYIQHVEGTPDSFVGMPLKLLVELIGKVK